MEDNILCASVDNVFATSRFLSRLIVLKTYVDHMLRFTEDTLLCASVENVLATWSDPLKAYHSYNICRSYVTFSWKTIYCVY